MPTTTEPLLAPGSIATVLNSMSAQLTGRLPIVNDDLSNFNDFGSDYSLLDSSTKKIVTSGMITLVTEQLFPTKEWGGIGVDLIRDRSDYSQGAGIIQKNRPPLPIAYDDSNVYDPEPGSSSDPFVNYEQETSTDYFYKNFQFKYRMSIADRWMTGMFLSVDGFNKFVAAIYQQIENAVQLNVDDLTLGLIRGSMILNLHSVDDLGGVGNARAVNLLALYNEAYPQSTPLLKANALTTPEFLRFAANRMSHSQKLMSSYSTLFNQRGYPNFTTKDNCHFLRLAMFDLAIDQFMMSDVYNTKYLELPLADSLATWKGLLNSGIGAPDFDSLSRINDTVEFGGETITMDMNGIVAHVFDKEHLGIYQFSLEKTQMPDPEGLKTNHWTHAFGRALTDPNENSVTFYLADPTDVVIEG